MGDFNFTTNANTNENNNNNNNLYYNNTNSSNHNDDTNTGNNHYRSTSDIAANIKLGTPNGGGHFQPNSYQTTLSNSPPQTQTQTYPSAAFNSTPIPQHPLMSLPPPITSAMNSQAKPPPSHSSSSSSSIGNIYHHRESPASQYNNNTNINEHNSFTLRASPHFQMLGQDSRSNDTLQQQQHHHQQLYSGGTDAAFDHVPQSHINGYPLSQPKPTLPLPANHHQQPQQPQQPPSQQQLAPSEKQTTTGSSSNDRFDSLLYHMGQPSKSNSQFVRQFLHHLNQNHSVNLKFIKNLNTMTENWSEEEIKASRRLVRFNILHGENTNNTMQVINFDALKPIDYEVTQAVVSCIYWREKNKFICTSVDIILLLEYFVHQSFGIEEKNRIRRNLQSLKPTTVSRSNKNDRDFFSLIMSMENPRPRNIEKDLKVFNWSDLGKAIAKVMSKYYIVSSPSPGSANLWCNGGHQLHNVPLSGAQETLDTSGGQDATARHGNVTTYTNSYSYHGSPPPSHKPSLPPLALVAPISGSSTPIQSQFPPSLYTEGSGTGNSSSTSNLQSVPYQEVPNGRRTDINSPLSAQFSGGAITENSNVCRQVTPTYQESKQQYHHHRYHSPPAGFPVPLPLPRLYPSSKIPISQGTPNGSSPPPPLPPSAFNCRSSVEMRNNRHPIRGGFNGLTSTPSTFASNEELLLLLSDYSRQLNADSSRGVLSTSGHPPAADFSQSPSPGKEADGDTSSGSERCSSSNGSVDDVDSAISENSKISGENSDDSGQSNKNNGVSSSGSSSISSGTKDSTSLYSSQRDSGNSSEDSTTRPNSVPGSGKFAPLSFNNNSSMSLLGSNGGTVAAAASLPKNKSNLRSLIGTDHQSPIVENKVDEGGETEGDDGVKDEDESMEDDQDDIDEDSEEGFPPVSKKRKRRSQRKMRKPNTAHQLQDNATSQYFDNNRDKKYLSQKSLSNGELKPHLPPISQILNAELYPSDNMKASLSPGGTNHYHHQQSPPSVVTDNEPLIRKVQNWDDY